ncbi:MAG: arsenate reductase ArsC [Candidatus Omnitrophica bacterium]|nr:arsenate reductase ArsC [Candidatus Omnitrophota bacterium]
MDKKKVLFLCTGNSARSQMAEGFLKSLAGDKFDAYSAGMRPTRLHPLAVKVMQEAGIDISKYRSKPAAEFLNQKFDYVITVCDNAQQTCPVFPGTYETIHWDLEDPAAYQGSEEEKLLLFRKIRKEIKRYILAFANLPN